MLKQRLMTAMLLIPLVFYVLFSASAAVFSAATVLLIGLAGWEWPTLMGKPCFKVRIGYVVLLFSLLWLSQFLSLWLILSSALLTWLLLTYGVLVYPAQQECWNKAFILAVLGILVLLPLFWVLNYLHSLSHAKELLIILLLLIWGADTCAYFIGRRFGRDKLIPAVSPNKSWQGFYAALGSSFVVVLAAVFYWDTILAEHYLAFFILGLVTTLASVVGDLAESMLKRAQNVKDSGNLLPGHGGILDRIDSLTAAAPIYTLGLMLLGIH